MGNFFIGLLVPIVIGTLIIAIILMAPKKKKQTTTGSPTQSTPAGGGNTPPPAGHANPHPTKKKLSTFGIIIRIIISIILVVGLIFGFLFLINRDMSKKGPSHSEPEYTTIFEEVRRKTVNLTDDFNGIDSVNLEYGQKCKFVNATVPFCVINKARQMICGDAYTHPDLPNGKANCKLWFKAQEGYTGTIELVILRRRNV